MDIAAKVPAGATTAEVRVMLQNLLVQRFRTKLHHEEREMPIYELAVGKTGSRLKESVMGAAVTSDASYSGVDADGYPVFAPGETA